MSRASTVVARDETEIATFYAQNRTPVSLDEMSPHMSAAILAIEYRDFYDHGGVDLGGILRVERGDLGPVPRHHGGGARHRPRLHLGREVLEPPDGGVGGETGGGCGGDQETGGHDAGNDARGDERHDVAQG